MSPEPPVTAPVPRYENRDEPVFGSHQITDAMIEVSRAARIEKEKVSFVEAKIKNKYTFLGSRITINNVGFLLTG